KNTPPPNTSKDKKADKQDELTQDLFDYVAGDTCAPVASTSGTSETIKLPDLPKPINKVVNMPSKETPTNSSKPINQVLSAILLSRTQREEHLKKRAVELGEDPDVFVTITEKDRLDSIRFWDMMETDSRMCAWAIELEDDPKEHMNMTIRERLIGEEIIRRSLEEDGIISSWLDTDEEWQKNVSILQKNGMLW
ncbi:hypothetical protein RhiirC2_802247, partial [Rhizophagus irregularis]